MQTQPKRQAQNPYQHSRLKIRLVILIPLILIGCWSTFNILLKNSLASTTTSSIASSSTMSFRAVFVTVPNSEVAKKIAHGLISQKLAACVNIIPGIQSIYEWEGKITEDQEQLLMIKTQAHLFQELSSFVHANHPYSVPEVIGVPIEQGSEAYLNWIREVTTANKAKPQSESS